MEVAVIIDSHEVTAGSVTREGDVQVPPPAWHIVYCKFISDSATVSTRRFKEVLTHL
jgi:hypothetical protein